VTREDPGVPAASCGDRGFSVLSPLAAETPLLVEIPHAGLMVDEPARATLMAPAEALARDADLWVDELYADAPAAGATVLVAHVSRYVCDLNRAESDLEPRAARAGRRPVAPHGLVWCSTTTGAPALAHPIDETELTRRLELYYRPYHRVIGEILAHKRARFGFAILLCAHSMPSRSHEPSDGGADAGRSAAPRQRADIVPGSRGGTTAAAAVVDCPELLARERGWSVAHDQPFRGGYSTLRYGHPVTGVHAVQVEISRRLYMDEASLERSPAGFPAVRAYCRSLVDALSALDLT